MAIILQKGSNSNRQRRRNRSSQMSDINVTPFVDVMLVLLVIFMVTAPLLTIGVPVDLPKAEASLIQEPDEPLTISIKVSGDVFLQDSKIDLEKLVPRLLAVTRANENVRIFVRGDKSVSYGKVMEIMSMVSAAGFNKVALITEMPTRNKILQKRTNKR